jgi:hypothetical protein
MRLPLVFAASLAAAMSFGQAVVLRGSGGYGIGSEYNRFYSNRSLTRFTGTVTGKIKGTPMRGMAESATILVRVPRSGVVSVDLGPSWFLQNQETKINVGDRVTVVGSRIRLNGQRLVLARQVIKGKRVLALRNAAGVPYWDPSRRGTVTVTANQPMTQATISETRTYNINGTEMVGYVVDTAGGPATVIVGPRWYLENQDVTFGPGQNIRFFGPTIRLGPDFGGGQAILANTIYGNNTTFVLRGPNGVPVWGGRP